MLTLTDSITNLFTNPMLNGIGFIIGLLGLLVGIVSVVLVIRKKKAFYTIQSNNFINDKTRKFEKLSIAYDGNPINNFTLTNIKFWNNSDKPIIGDYVPKGDPLTITVKDNFEILDANVIKMTDANNVNEFAIERIDKKTMKINFKYIEQNEGLEISVAHTGKSTKDINFSGRIIGWKILNSERVDTRSVSLFLVMTIILVLGSIAIVPSMIMYVINNVINVTLSNNFTAIINIPIFLIIGVIDYAVLTRMSVRAQIPKGLQ